MGYKYRGASDLRVMSHARDVRLTRHFWLIFCIFSRLKLKSLSFCGLSSLQFSLVRKTGHGAPGGISASCSVTSHTYSSAISTAIYSLSLRPKSPFKQKHYYY